MKTVAIFKNGSNQAIRLPKEMQFDDISELEIEKVGNTVTLRPVKANWLSLASIEPIDDFLVEREDVIAEEGRFDFD
ncbi:AbrB/MazE/SpoVT family DNA-binding domain-containing protein [Shewanella sp. 202IG2-18]|uniref:type II toxin-antitoxin system VapB family antitoxin n=1 Tax=Parashewanella hymeniacidonis TaxID=2807618 RepID=UPI0019605379|nr:type II toxin-antitoxin system VapB family antitoxin [Parashewanella hymeniacidonis]MBM7073045.1 AbrB/MazE/SpoVT family DNA-binding domain-containing protein [Parashewanella hymeniacidonis]